MTAPWTKIFQPPKKSTKNKLTTINSKTWGTKCLSLSPIRSGLLPLVPQFCTTPLQLSENLILIVQIFGRKGRIPQIAALPNGDASLQHGPKLKLPKPGPHYMMSMCSAMNQVPRVFTTFRGTLCPAYFPSSEACTERTPDCKFTRWRVTARLLFPPIPASPRSCH